MVSPTPNLWLHLLVGRWDGLCTLGHRRHHHLLLLLLHLLLPVRKGQLMPQQLLAASPLPHPVAQQQG